MEKNKLFELLYLIVLFSTLLYIGPATLFHHNLSHEKPIQYGATDGFFYAMLSEHVYQVGNFRYNPFYSNAGFNESIAYHPPLLMQVTSSFAYLSGLNAYDSLSLLLGLFVLFGAFIIYWLIRSYNRSVAILSTAIFVFIFVFNFVIGYVWGEALLLMGSFFLISLFFLMNNREIKYWWLFLGILIAATINTHTSETIFFYGFVVLFILIKFLFNQLSKEELFFLLKQLSLATLLAIILSFNYLIIFYNGYYKITGSSYSSFRIMTPEEFGAIKVPPLYDFGAIALFFIITGIIISLFLLKKNIHTAIITALFMFLIGMSNYAGIHYRAFQTRFLWPIYLALFFGLSTYFILKRLSKNYLFYFLISSLLITAFIYSYYHDLNLEMVSDDQWKGFKWLEQNTPERSRLLFFYGDGYSQSLRIIKRLVFLAEPDNLFQSFINNKISPQLIISPVLQDEMFLIYRKSLFDFGFYAKEQNITIRTAMMNVCDFDYYIFDKFSQFVPDINKINIIFIDRLKDNNASQVYENNNLVIFKNNNLRGNCFG